MNMNMRSVVRFAALVALCACASARADAPMANCVDRLAGEAPSDFDRLPQVRYVCLRLSNGRHLLAGEAGRRDAPTVLLIHGLGHNAHRDWRATVPALIERFRVVVLDLPGFGASQSFERGYSFEQLDAALSEAAERLALQRFHLVGHSLGAAISLHFAHRHPQRIDRLVLVSAAGVLIKPVFARHLIEANASALGMDPFAQLMSLFGSGGRDSLLDLLEDQGGLTRLILESPGIRGALFGFDLHADAALRLIEHDFTDAIREVSVPTIAIWGGEDPVTPLRTGKLLALRMPSARLVVLDRSQHMPMNQQPAEFNAALIEALTGSAAIKDATPLVAEPKGSARCVNQPNMRYRGVYTSITLENCANAVIEQSRIGTLTVASSSVILEDTVIEGGDIALVARSSTVTGTGVKLSARTAVQAQDSMIDLAGATLEASARGVDAQRSRVYFSVSDYRAPEYRGPAHFIWPPPAAALP